MPKRPTKKQYCEQIGKLICGEDTRITERTKPVFRTAKKERDVLDDCLSWLKGRQVTCDRLNNGAGVLHGSIYYCTYGIPGAGDIVGLLRPTGRHFEIECKHGRGGTLSVTQVRRRQLVEGSGGLYFVVHNEAP